MMDDGWLRGVSACPAKVDPLGGSKRINFEIKETEPRCVHTKTTLLLHQPQENKIKTPHYIMDRNSKLLTKKWTPLWILKTLARSRTWP